MANELERLQDKLRDLAKFSGRCTPDGAPFILNGFNLQLRGYGHSTLSLAVHKATEPVEFAHEQAEFMLFLGEQVCPRILSVDEIGYVMEFLQPARIFVDSVWAQERFLYKNVWTRSLEDVPFAKIIGDDTWHGELSRTIGIDVPEWAINEPICLIHGDPTLDNTLMINNGSIRITDPIPPHRLVRPSIRAIDHGKILQSFLGWEVVFRGMPRVEFMWPSFMLDIDSAKRAVFWCMVALKRIALRNNSCNAGLWAQTIGEELKQCLQSF